MKGIIDRMDSILFPDSWDLKSKINNLQRRILLNSIAYYQFDTSFLEDKQYDALSRQLVILQKEYGDVRDTMYGYVFHDFEGSTGFDLYFRLTPKDQDNLMEISRIKMARYA